MNNPHTINWFEIPVTDIGRATEFYETVMGVKLEMLEMEGAKMAVFPSTKNTDTMTVHGALIQSQEHTPSTNGVVIYFNGGNDLSDYTNKIEAAGGKITVPKFSIGEHGFCSWFTDTEGNQLAFHSPN